MNSDRLGGEWKLLIGFVMGAALCLALALALAPIDDEVVVPEEALPLEVGKPVQTLQIPAGYVLAGVKVDWKKSRVEVFAYHERLAEYAYVPMPLDDVLLEHLGLLRLELEAWFLG